MSRGIVIVTVAILLVPAIRVTGQAGRSKRAAQDADAYVPTLTFDVASIRESPESDSYTVGGFDPAHSSVAKFTNNTAMDLIAIAYGMRWAQIEGAPDWVKSTRYMVEAKSDIATEERLAKLSDEEARAEKQHMLQMLLADRFQLTVKWQTQEGTIYNLVVARDGPKMSTKLEPPTKEQIELFRGAPVPPLYQHGDGRLGYEYIAHGATTGMVAMMAASQMGSNVVDKTGLAGKYDFALRYSGTVPGTGSRDPDAWPLLITALPEQLGLKLEPAKGPIQELVIEHIERPSAN
jgi:uncharacterized protein (TIGR03435 family)